MGNFKEITNSYLETDGALANLEIEARKKRYFKKELEYQNLRKLNDKAYFLYLFSRFEERLNDITNKLIQRKCKSKTNYKNIRVWQILKKYFDDDRLNLMHRVSLYLPNTLGDYSKIYEYKRQRDEIIHGGAGIITIHFPTALADMERFYKQIRLR